MEIFHNLWLPPRYHVKKKQIPQKRKLYVSLTTVNDALCHTMELLLENCEDDYVDKICN